MAIDTNDKKLMGQLRRSLPPESLDYQSDADLETLLDYESANATVTAARRGLPKWVFVAAAAVLAVAATAVYRALHQSDAGGAPGIAEEGDSLPAPHESIGTPPSFVPDEEPPSPPASIVLVPPTPTVPPEGDWVEIQPVFPKPMFVGTPVAAIRPNLEKPRQPRLSFKAPAGTVLVSGDAAVDSSDPAPIIGDLDMLTDGDKDGADGSYIEIGPGKQWVQIDLGESRELWAVLLWHFHKNARAYDDVIVQVSDDAAFASGVETVFNNDHDNSSGFGVGGDPAWVETNHGRIIGTSGVRGRYLRAYSNGNTANEMNHYVEIEIYGR